MSYKECQKCHKPSARCKYCKDCLDSFPGWGDRVFRCTNINCGQEYCTNSYYASYCPNCLEKLPGEGSGIRNCINPDCGQEYRSSNRNNSYCPDCKASVGVGRFVRKCDRCKIMTHTTNRDYPLCPDCEKEYRSERGIHGYCPDCRNSVGVGDMVRKCVNCPVMTHTYSKKYPLCPKCLDKLPGEGSYVLECDTHKLYKAKGPTSVCPICFEEAKGEGNNLYSCINPECNKKYRSNSYNGASYCPDCVDKMPGKGSNVIVCSIHGPHKGGNTRSACPGCVEKARKAKEEADAAEKARFDALPGVGAREGVCCVKGCKERFKTNAWGEALNHLMCEKHKKEHKEAERARKEKEKAAKKARLDTLSGEGDYEATCCVESCTERFKTTARGAALTHLRCERHKKEYESVKIAEKEARDRNKLFKRLDKVLNKYIEKVKFDALPGEGNHKVRCKRCKEWFKCGSTWGYCPNCKKEITEKAKAEKEAKLKRERESYPVAIKFLIDNFGAKIFDINSVKQFEYTPEFADSLEGKCGVVPEFIDGKVVNLIKSVNLGQHLKEIIKVRNGKDEAKSREKRATAKVYKEGRVTYGVLVASEDMSSIMALVYELLAALMLKPIYWTPENSGIVKFQYRIYVDCEDPREVFKNEVYNKNY